MKKCRSLKWVGVALLVSLPVVIIIYRVFYAPDPCRTQATNELVVRYPGLKKLQHRQQRATEALLIRQRAQDVVVNLKMNSAQISPEQALQLSVQQVSELAALRKHQQQEFISLCHKLTGHSD